MIMMTAITMMTNTMLIMTMTVIKIARRKMIMVRLTRTISELGDDGVYEDDYGD